MNCKPPSFLLLVALMMLWPVTPLVAFGQSLELMPKTVSLVSRRKVGEYDNYSKAAFSFKYGMNGDESLKLTHNNWDLLFGDSDTFDVTMVTDDCSRIQDLGEFGWFDSLRVPVLVPHPQPAREPSVPAIVGHMYVVHTKDRDNDHYALFRVEYLEPNVCVTISWKLILAPKDDETGSCPV